MTTRTPSPGKKAQHTAKWARTMTKWLITYSRRKGARWNVVDFGGRTKAESRGIVDLMAIRKDHRNEGPSLKRGDLFEIVLIQTKGGSASKPTAEDRARLSRVARHYRAKRVVLATWHHGASPELSELHGSSWKAVAPSEIFG